MNTSALRLAAAERAGQPVTSCPIEVDDATVDDFLSEFLLVSYSYIYDRELCKFTPSANVGFPGNTTTNRKNSNIFRDGAFETEEERRDSHTLTFVHEFGHHLGLGHAVRAADCDLESGGPLRLESGATGDEGRRIAAVHCRTVYVARHSVMANNGTIFGSSISAPRKR